MEPLHDPGVVHPLLDGYIIDVTAPHRLTCEQMDLSDSEKVGASQAATAQSTCMDSVSGDGGMVLHAST